MLFGHLLHGFVPSFLRTVFFPSLELLCEDPGQIPLPGFKVRLLSILWTLRELYRWWGVPYVSVEKG